ncbi:hypothetical protein CAPTEDRAFT_194706 [Capitella teleta]|uniref:Uncharacterized protein n=1 Tax=Capitella teleta TaxID=283909 RepID=R7VC88_CAPTE|nr:hypothetical protein CAPTEDRAFT_194706 [Capitella teleta]|eukprot:ELU16224.1 hypothetical protein CAPTEDRAFT_194706 [Capitella teleta]
MRQWFFVLLVLPVALHARRLGIIEVDPIGDRDQTEEQRSKRGLFDILQPHGNTFDYQNVLSRSRRSTIDLFDQDSSQLTQDTKETYQRFKRSAGCLIKGKKYEFGEKWEVNRGDKSYMCTCPENFPKTKRIKCKRQVAKKPACQLGGEFLEEGDARYINLGGVLFMCSCNSSEVNCIQKDQVCQTADGATFRIGEYFNAQVDGFLQDCVCRAGNNSFSSNSSILPYAECNQINEETSTTSYGGWSPVRNVCRLPDGSAIRTGEEANLFTKDLSIYRCTCHENVTRECRRIGQYSEKMDVNGICKLPDGRNVTRGLYDVVVNNIYFDCMCSTGYVKCGLFHHRAGNDTSYMGNATAIGSVTPKPNGSQETTCLLPDHRFIGLGEKSVIKYGGRTYECTCEGAIDRKASCKYEKAIHLGTVIGSGADQAKIKKAISDLHVTTNISSIAACNLKLLAAYLSCDASSLCMLGAPLSSFVQDQWKRPVSDGEAALASAVAELKDVVRGHSSSILSIAEARRLLLEVCLSEV